MINIFKFLFGGGADMQELIERGAVVIDVRSPAEFRRGHTTGAVNIPLSEISPDTEGLPAAEVPIITCCASGRRSGIARKRLKLMGFEAYNGGPWQNVQQYVDRAVK